MKTKSKISIWFMAIRPKTLPAAAAPVIIGTAMAFSEEKINILVFSLTLLAALLIQVGTNLANDYFDFIKGTDNRERVGPIRVTQSGLLSKKEVKISFILIFALAVACGIFLTFRGGIPILFIGMLAIICGIFYTAGPFPLGYIGLADIFVLIFFGPVAVGGTFYLQTLNINSNVIIAGIAPGLLSVAIITANNLRDIETDRKSGKKTLVVRFGYKFGVLEYYFCIIFSLLIPVILVLLTRDNLLSLISLLAIFPAILTLKRVASRPDAKTLIQILSNTGIILLIFSVLFSLGWIL